MVLALACLGLWLLYHQDWLIYLSMAFLFIGLVSRWFSDKIAWIWEKFAEFLGFVNSRVILGIIFFLVLTPLAFLFRLFSKDSLQLKRKKEGSYYTLREHLYKGEDLTKTW